MTECMVYVAADPNQPGAAWAICVDDPKYAKDTAKSLSQWVRDGANIQRVTKDEGCEMLAKWVRPETPRNKTPQVELPL